MGFDELQRTWQSQQSEPTIAIHPDTLLKLVQRNKRSLERAVFWRDVGEVGASILLATGCVVLVTRGLGWPYYVLAVSAAWVGGFMVVNRILQRRNTPVLHEPLVACIHSSLAQVNHQIWLLSHVFWWCLLPLGVGMLFAWADCVYLLRPRLWIDLPIFLGLFVLCAVVLSGVYCANQRCVREELRPRQQELEALLESLNTAKSV